MTTQGMSEKKSKPIIFGKATTVQLRKIHKSIRKLYPDLRNTELTLLQEILAATTVKSDGHNLTEISNRPMAWWAEVLGRDRETVRIAFSKLHARGIIRLDGKTWSELQITVDVEIDGVLVKDGMTRRICKSSPYTLCMDENFVRAIFDLLSGREPETKFNLHRDFVAQQKKKQSNKQKTVKIISNVFRKSLEALGIRSVHADVSRKASAGTRRRLTQQAASAFKNSCRGMMLAGIQTSQAIELTADQLFKQKYSPSMEDAVSLMRDLMSGKQLALS